MLGVGVQKERSCGGVWPRTPRKTSVRLPLCADVHSSWTFVQCVEVEPNRGELWCRVAKNPKNAHDKVEVLLKKVGQRLIERVHAVPEMLVPEMLGCACARGANAEGSLAYLSFPSRQGLSDAPALSQTEIPGEGDSLSTELGT
eukprot:1157152-Pelagomonas_calceolata.AAC.4